MGVPRSGIRRSVGGSVRWGAGRTGRPRRGTFVDLGSVGGRSRVGFTFLVTQPPSLPLGILGSSYPSLGREHPWLGGSGDGGVGGAGWGAPTVRLADRCHFLLGFCASGRGCPSLCPHLGSERTRPTRLPTPSHRGIRQIELNPRGEAAPPGSHP